VLQPSRLHRMLRMRPGRVPRWIASSGFCAGFDAISALQTTAIVAAIVLWQHALILAIVLIAAVVLFCVVLHIPFADVERFARARVRRRECVVCGATLVTHGAEECPNCGT